MKWNFDKTIICINCGKRPAVRKKVVMCHACYQRIVYLKKIGPPVEPIISIISNINHSAEIIFHNNHPSFYHHPACFHFGDEKYYPDFYDPDNNIFYEIIGSRQRFQQLREKLKSFINAYPKIVLVVCSGDGTSYQSKVNHGPILTPDQFLQKKEEEQ